MNRRERIGNVADELGQTNGGNANRRSSALIENDRGGAGTGRAEARATDGQGRRKMNRRDAKKKALSLLLSAV